MTATTEQELHFLGARARILTDGDATGGQLGLVEMIEVPAGQLPPLHVHHTHDEGFYVLSGQVTLYTPDTEVTLSAGDFFLAPRGVPHSYRVAEEAPASWLCTSSPAGFEKFVARVGGLDQQTPEAVTAAGAEYGIEILGPPGTMP
jgi:quercetin dioxygenase-like cupin family protein